MARNMYGATSADFTITSGGRVIPGAELTLWTARTGGTQITDLLDVDSVATTTVTSAADGSVVYYGPNSDKTVHWADSGQGARVAIRPVDITGDPPALSIGTVGTGTAAATLTGTSEAPVLNLTLPSAGANGVDTAAIQSKAVTAAKIADDTITAAQIAANAVGASELADNAVDTAAIADNAVTGAKIADGSITDDMLVLDYERLHVPTPTPATVDPDYVATSASYRIGWMSSDGRCYNRREDRIRRSTDGSAWTTVESAGPWRNKRQTITVGGSGLTSYTLTLGATTTGSIAADADAATVQAALNAALGAGVTAVIGSAGGPWTATFTGVVSTATAVEMMTATPTGGTGTVTIARLGLQSTLVREVSDGELMVCMDGGAVDPGASPGRPAPEVWMSSGYDAGGGSITGWDLTLTGSDSGAWFDPRWGHWVEGDDVFLLEYGIQSAACAAKKCYHSADNGQTWRTIFTHPNGNPAEGHGHGVAYDRWWDCVWITVGDGTLNRAIYVSYDWAENTPTWEATHTGTPAMVGVYPLREKILFGSDDKPDGIYAYNRLGYRQISALTLIHPVGPDGATFRYLAQTMWRASDDDPLIIPWAPSSSPAQPAKLTLTPDGITWYDMWTDPQGEYVGGYSQGLFSAFGPTQDGTVVGDLRDDRQPYTLFRATMPNFRERPTTFTPNGDAVTIVAGSDGVLAVVEEDGTTVDQSSSAPLPEDQQLIAWAFDPIAAGNKTVLVAGTAYVVRIPIRRAATITNILLYVEVAGSGLTAGQCFAALYQDNALLAATADQASAWAGSGLKTMTLASPQAVEAGFVDVLFWAQGSTPPQMSRANLNTSAGNAGASTPRFATANTGLTTTPPATIGTRTITAAYWAAVS